MTEKKEKEQKKKITPGMAATANRLETSHAVLSALKEVGSISGGQAASLASAAQAALALLKVVQDSEEDVDEDLVSLVIDTCGLMYIIIDACGADNGYGVGAVDTNVSSLTEAIDNFRIFCMKKIRGSFYRKIKKRGEDEKLMDGFRDHLRAWLLFFGGDADSLVHDYLEEVISRKLRPQSTSPKPDVRPPQPPKPPSISLSSSYAHKPVPPIPGFPIPAVQIQFPSPSTTSPVQPQPSSGLAQPTPMTYPPSPKPLSLFDSGDSDSRAQRRLADDLRRQEERERWRRSEEMYNSLPPASPDDNSSQAGLSLDAITAHMKQSHSQSMIMPQPKPQLKPTPGSTENVSLSRPVSPRLPAVTGTVRPPPTEEDPAVVRARQVEEDRVTAMLLAGEMQLEIEAAERERAKRKTSKRHKDKHRPPAINDTGSGNTSDSSPIPVHIESPTAPGSPFRPPPFLTSSLSRSNSLSAAGSRPASPRMPRPRRSPSPLKQDAPSVSRSPPPSGFLVSSSNELRPPMSASMSRDRDGSQSVAGPRRSSDAVRPLPSPLQQRFSAEEITSDTGGGLYIKNVSKSGISFGSGSVKVRNVGN